MKSSIVLKVISDEHLCAVMRVHYLLVFTILEILCCVEFNVVRMWFSCSGNSHCPVTSIFGGVRNEVHTHVYFFHVNLPSDKKTVNIKI